LALGDRGANKDVRKGVVGNAEGVKLEFDEGGQLCAAARCGGALR